MKNQRKIAVIVLLSMLIATFHFVSVSALRIGDEIGYVLNTDIRTYINGYRIPSYNINNRSAILIRDLINYGFDAVYDESTRSSRVTYNPNKTVTPLTDFYATAGPVGSVAFSYVYTDIVAYVNNRRVESFNIRGYLAIFFGDLADYGTFAWNDATRESKFTTTREQLVTGITLNRNDAVITAGESLRLTATLAPYNATNRALTWSSSNPSVAQVTGTGYEGYIVGGAPGTAVITVRSSNGITASCTVTVQQAGVPVTQITLNRTTATIGVNEAMTLVATITPTYATDRTVTWSSSNPSVVKVYSDGSIIGTTAGTAVITATSSNGLTATCTVTVQQANIPATRVTLDRTTAAIGVNETFQLRATIAPDNADRTVTWSSSNPNVVWVDQNGYVWGLAAGTSVITVTTASGRTANCTVTVSADVPPTGITLYETRLELILGNTYTLTATVTPAYATDKTIVWWSEFPAIADVNQNGTILAKSAGTTRIFARTSNGIITSCIVTVIAPSPR